MDGAGRDHDSGWRLRHTRRTVFLRAWRLCHAANGRVSVFRPDDCANDTHADPGTAGLKVAARKVQREAITLNQTC